MLKQYMIKYYYPSGTRSKTIVNANSPAEAVHNFYLTHSSWYMIRKVKEIHALTEEQRKYKSNFTDGVIMTILFEIAVFIMGVLLYAMIIS